MIERGKTKRTKAKTVKRQKRRTDFTGRDRIRLINSGPQRSQPCQPAHLLPRKRRGGAVKRDYTGSAASERQGTTFNQTPAFFCVLIFCAVFFL